MTDIQEQLLQSEKMEAVRRLAQRIAHDFNNFLSIIKGYSQLCRMEFEKDTPILSAIEKIEAAADQAALVTYQLLAFSGRQVMDMRILDLNTVLKDLDKTLRDVLGQDVELVMFLEKNLGKVRIDVAQMKQVLINLALNAKEAMPCGGRLTIKTSNSEPGNDCEGVPPGDSVMLSVTDTGFGMTEEVRKQAFEPFFTTKEKGNGRGLGLSAVYGIVKQSGGSITIDAERGRGSSFNIHLPCAEERLD